MLVYKCMDLTNSSAANTSAPCHSVHEEANACRGNLLIAGWAVGAGVRKYFYMYMYICVWMIHNILYACSYIPCDYLYKCIYTCFTHLDICVS